MSKISGILRIVLGLVVLGAGVGTYFNLAEKFERTEAKVMLGSTGIEVTWPVFLLCTILAGALGFVMIVLGVFALKDD